MPNLLTRLARAAGYAPAQKAAPATVAFYGEGRPVWMARDPGAFAREGYQRNAIAHRAVRLVAEAAAALPLTLSGADDAHPLTALLARPNPREGGTRFLEGVYGHLMVSGNAALWSKCTKGVEASAGNLRHIARDCYSISRWRLALLYALECNYFLPVAALEA